VDPVLGFATGRVPAIKTLLGQLVKCESPSDDPAAVNRFVELVADTVAPVARVRTYAGGRRFGRQLVAEFRLPGRKKTGRILALGHSDTVWPVGTLASMPWREAGGRLYGPGVLDMKAGIAFFLEALGALRELAIPVPSRVFLQLNSDEEVGSLSSRALTERLARVSQAVLVLEPGTGLAGKLKTARKGVGDFTITVRGRAAHAGLDFEAGASAVVELARQIERVASFTRLERGLTVNPGVVSGGTRGNVVAAEARTLVDIRVVKLRDAPALERRFRALRPFDRRCTVEVSGGLNRPPMERSAGIVKLFGIARRLARTLGVDLEESLSGGGSDGNFTAALGAPTLDGIGGVGEGAHAPHESILVDRIADRTALLAKLVAAL
jgi:glutamate carboxypeptidase